MSRPFRILGTYLLLPMASVAFALTLFEVGLRFAGYKAIYETYSKPWLFWQHDPLLGWSHQPGAREHYVGPRPWPIEFDAEVRINTLGLRGPEVPPPSPDELRVLFLGDSMVASFEVEYEQSFVALLEEELRSRLGRPVRTINGGVRGYGSDQSYLYFRERGHLLEPDLVVFFHSANDLVDNITLHEMRRPYGKSALRPGPDGLEAVVDPVPRYPECSEVLLTEEWEVKRVDTGAARLMCRGQTLLFDRSALFSVLTLAVRQNGQLLIGLYRFGNPHYRQVEKNVDGDPDFDYSTELTMAILRSLGDEVRRRGAGLLITGVPNQLAALDLPGLESGGTGIFALSALDEVPREDVRWRNDSHFNPEGHRLVARVLSDPIETRLRSAEPGQTETRDRR